jgi:hypothetical protein
MRLDASAHTSRPWRVHEVAPDFALEDVWALPTPGGPDDFPRLVELVADRVPGGPERSGTERVSRLLWTARERVGGALGWDDPAHEDRTPSLRGRLPADLRGDPGPAVRGLPFRPVFRTDDEWVAEIANRTVHGLLHLGWVPSGDGGYRGQLAVLVKPNGLLGTTYLTAISPFRHWFVYPAMMRRLERGWRAG